MARATVTTAALLLALTADAAAGFSLPGVQMTTYKKSEHLPLFVNSLTSSETLLPLDYYKLPFCQVRLAMRVCVALHSYLHNKSSIALTLRMATRIATAREDRVQVGEPRRVLDREPHPELAV